MQLFKKQCPAWLTLTAAVLSGAARAVVSFALNLARH